MTKREICERLMNIRDNMILGQDSANSMGELSCVLSATGKLIRDLLLDLAAPDDHIADAGKMVREEVPHSVIAKPGKDGEIEWCWCQKCYGAADVVHDPFGDGNDWSYCKKCGVSFRLKCREEGDKAWYGICPWRPHGKNHIGLECSPLYCSQCVHKPETHKRGEEGK